LRKFRKRSDALAAREMEDEVLLLDMEANLIHQLNPAASVIWQRLASPASMLEIAESLVSRFDVALETAERDVAEMVDRLQALGLIVESKEGEPDSQAGTDSAGA
jgi:hypothetical protein